MNKVLKSFYTTTFILLTSFASTPAISATADGTLGATSTATIDVTLTIAEQFQISGVAAFALGSRSAGAGDLQSNQDVCIYHNGDGSYRVTFSDDSTGGTGAGYNIEDAGDANTVSYAVRFNDVTGTVGQIVTTDGTATAAQSGANNQTTDCSTGGDSANIEVFMTGANLDAAPNGSYDSELTVLVEAD